MYGLRHEITLS